jgi:Tetratricopeptide repeat
MKRVSHLILGLIICATVVAQEQNPGEQAIARKDWKSATEYFRKAVGSDAKDGRSWYQLGVALHGLSNYDEAAKAFEQAAKFEYLVLRSEFHQALEFASLGDKDRAFEVLNGLNKQGFVNVKALESDPGFGSLHSDDRWQAVVEAAQRNATPCEHTAENRQFDFWIGEWDVQTTDGQHAGDSNIQRILSGCALLENWEGAGPGKSINSYNTVRRQWQQLWVDAGGEVHEYAGGLVNGEMIFEGPAADHDGHRTVRRMTFTRLANGRVKQKGETSPDGKTWSVEYELIYVPKSSASAHGMSQ